MSLEDSTEPFVLVEAVTTIMNDSPGMGESQECTTRSTHGPFTSVREYRTKMEELITQRMNIGWRPSNRRGVSLERLGGEIYYFADIFSLNS